MTTMKNIVEKKLNASSTADSQKEANVTAPPVVEKPAAKEEEQMSEYKKFLIKDIEETKEEQKE